MVMYTGVHEVWDKYVKGTGTGLQTFEKLFTGIVQKCNAANIKLIVCTPAGWIKPDFDKQLTVEVDEYALLMRTICNTYDVHVADLNTMLAEENFVPQEPLSPLVTANKIAGDEVWRIMSFLK